VFAIHVRADFLKVCAWLLGKRIVDITQVECLLAFFEWL